MSGLHPRHLTHSDPKSARAEAEQDAEAAWREWFLADDRVGGTSEAFIAGFMAGEGWTTATTDPRTHREANE